VRKCLVFLMVVLGLFASCEQSRNPVVAIAFHQKLYTSDVLEKLPYTLSKEDSLLFMEQYIEDWILRQTLLVHAKQALTQNEQDFSAQLKQYKEQLLINAYFQKLGRDTSLFHVSKQELADFLNTAKSDEAPKYKDMVKLNYIKLSNPSKLYKPIKELFFDEKDRVNAIKQLELLCADTIEYYLDNNNWLYTEYIESELSFSFSGKEKENKDKFDFVKNGNRYLILILDKKRQIQPKISTEDRKIAQALLEQQKRAAFFANYKDSLVQKAKLEKNAVIY